MAYLSFAGTTENHIRAAKMGKIGRETEELHALASCFSPEFGNSSSYRIALDIQQYSTSASGTRLDS